MRQDEISEWQEEFREKAFYEENRRSYRTAIFTSYACNVISVATALSFPLITFFGVIPEWLPLSLRWGLSGLLSVGLLILLEMELRTRLKTLFRGAVKNGLSRVGGVNMAVSGLLIGLSMYSSVEGARLFIQQADRRKEMAEAEWQATAEQMKQEQSARLRGLQQELDDYKKSVMWAGRIDVSNRTTAQVISYHTERIKQAEEQARTEYEQARTAHETRIQEAGESTLSAAQRMMIFSGCTVLLYLALMFFIYYYRRRSLAELETNPELATVSIRPNPSPSTTPALSSSIGFRTPARTETQDDTPAQSPPFRRNDGNGRNDEKRPERLPWHRSTVPETTVPTVPELMIALGVWATGFLVLTVLYKIATSVKEEIA